MGTYQEGRDAGLWGDDGVPYDISDGDDPNALSKKDFMDNYPNHGSNKVFEGYKASQFPGMRETGRVENFDDYAVAEYEDNGLRLKSIADGINESVLAHFVLYDYKGSVQSNNSSAIHALKEKYGSNIEINGDVLLISDEVISINKNSPAKSDNKNKVTQYWHMQLHPNQQSWGREIELLENLSLIGHGKSSSATIFANFSTKMNINDIVLVKNGSRPIAIVKVISEVIDLDDNKNISNDLDWFRYRRNIKILSLANDDMQDFPQPRGTLSLAKDTKSQSYKYIENWLKDISSSGLIPNLVSIPTQINLNTAKPSFGVEAIAKTLSSIIINIPERSGMMIGVFGKWGRGKTYLVNKIWENISSQTLFHRVNFSAWKYQDTKESWAYLYETMMKQYLSEDSKVKLGKSTKSLPKTLGRYHKLWKLNLQKHKWFPIISFIMVFGLSLYWSFFADKISIIKAIVSTFGLVLLAKMILFYFQQRTTAIGLLTKYFYRPSFSDYLGLQAEVENELESLMKTWIPDPSNNEKVLLFVDDIDRCDFEKVISIVDGLRIILDNPEIHKRLLIVTAIDEEILREALVVKYNAIKILNIPKMYQEYLEKVFIIGIKLNKLEKIEMEEYLGKILPDLNLDTKEEQDITNDKSIAEEKSGDENINEELSELEFTENKELTELELTEDEKRYLITSIQKLKDATPRKIKIFYYKYLILKQLFHVRLTDKNLIEKWDIHNDEKIIMDILIHISNQQPISDFIYDVKDNDILDALKYSSNMVSAL